MCNQGGIIYLRVDIILITWGGEGLLFGEIGIWKFI